MWGELAQSFQNGNPYIMAMMFLAFFATVILFERIIMLQFVYHIDFKKFVMNLKKMVIAEDLNRAMTFCRSVSGTSLPRITLRALEAADTDPTTVRGTIEEETMDFLPKIENRIGLLPAFSTLLVLLGVLGTIESLWNAFHSIDVLDSAKKQAVLSQGVAAALNPTAMGLLAAMIILFGYQMVRGMAISLTERMQYGVSTITNLLAPQEMMAFAPPAMEAPAPSPVAFAAPAPAEAAAEPVQQVTTDASFNEAAVEDIKDEEEII